MTLDELIAAARTLPAEAPLVFSTENGPISAGYHVTEIRLATISSIDCGARTNAWTEATLQLLDGQGGAHMPVGKFVGILDRSARRVVGLGDSPIRIEYGHGGLRLFEPLAPKLADGVVSVTLSPVRAQCKPALAPQAHALAACCGVAASGCCG